MPPKSEKMVLIKITSESWTLRYDYKSLVFTDIDPIEDGTSVVISS